MSTETTYCKRHPKEETALRCSRCEDLICPKCAVLTPVGYRCARCGKEKSATMSAPPKTLLIGGASGFVLGFVSSVLVPSVIGFFVLFLGAIVGGFIGEIVSRLCGRKKSRLIAGMTAAGFILGAFFLPTRGVLGLVSEGVALETAISVARFPLWALAYAIIGSIAAWARLTW